MLNYSIQDAKTESSSIVTNSLGVNNSSDFFVSWIGGIFTAIIHAHNNDLQNIIKKTDINNMVGLELDVEGEKYNVIRQQASQAEGQVVFNITNILAQIDIGTEFIGNNNKYNATATTVGQVLAFGDISRDLLITKIETFVSTKTAIVYCDNHGLSNNIQLTGYNFAVAGLSGIQTITSFDKNSFVFTNNSIVANAIITPSASEYFDTNIIKTNIRSVETGSIQNIDRGLEVVPTNAIQYINASGYIDYNEIGLGADTETDDNYRARIVARKTKNTAIAEIETLVLNQSGITRVAIVQTTPSVGNFTVYFLRDNDNNPIPTQQEIDAVKNALIDKQNLHATITKDNVFVNAPIELKRRFVVNGLLPNTAKMQEAVKAQLQEIIFTIGIQDTTKTPPTDSQVRTLLIQRTQDATGNTISNINSIDILDINNVSATLTLGVGEFISVDNISFA